MPDTALAPQTTPPPPANDSGSLLKAMTAGDMQTQALLNKEQAQMAPAYSAANTALSQPAQPPPAFESQPKAPDMRQQQAENAQEFMTTAALVAGIAGALSKQHVTTALNAFGATIKGLKEGQFSAANQAAEEFKQSSEATTATNNTKQQAYQNAMSDRKLSIDEQMSKIQLIAAQYHDQLMYQAASAKNFMMVANLLERQREADQRWQQSTDRMQQQWEEFKTGFEAKYGDIKTAQERLTAASQVYARLFPADATGRRVTTDGKGQVQPAPPFEQWFQTEYPKIAPMLQGTGAVPAPGGPAAPGQSPDQLRKSQAQTALDSGVDREAVKRAYIGDGGTSFQFDADFPPVSPRPLPDF